MKTGQPTANDTSSGLFLAPGKGRVYFRNQGANTVFIGPVGVTTANGFPLAINESVDLAVRDGDDIHAVCAAAETATVAYTFSSEY